MEQREVTDTENTTWTCVQAYAALGKEVADKAGDADNMVTLVCTPSGGAQTVRLQVPNNWLAELSDEQLVNKISQVQKEQV
ncbi:hypothetical protein FVR03_05800 [Pontibacter qinzhouensis]|uniref:Uncharacterized protein n=1 Tax=Pontibacter qinzhouensis TaxID=2603253 RepID=A0A5C8KC27_9BACT|nr:hypothetical protein [Pontibacter qinzhouensis]TXK49833.1 hypothetical protein FVR03_05800 [Pontibacter qinzhouensis]